MSNRNLATALAMDTMRENNENLQMPASHLADWRVLMGLRAGVGMERQNLARKLKSMEAEQSLSSGPSPLSPKNQQMLGDRMQTGTKRSSFAFSQQEEQELLQKSAKRAKLSHDALLLAALGGTRTNPLLSHLQPQLPITSPLMLNPSLLAASAGYANAAAAQQLMLSQALASTTGVSPLVQQQINSLIKSEFSRLAAADSSPPSTSPLTIPKSDPPVGMRNSPTSVPKANIACLELGKEFLPSTTQRTRLCDCGMALCMEVGYPHRGSVPFSAQNVDQWCKTLDITDSYRLRQIKATPESFSLAYWHFREEHQKVDEQGQVTLWQNSEALPDAHLQTFVDEYKRLSPRSKEVEKPRQPSKKMVALHNQWVQFRRAPALEP